MTMKPHKLIWMDETTYSSVQMKAKSWSRKQDPVLHAKNNPQMSVTIFEAISPCLVNGRDIRLAKGVWIYTMTSRDLRNTFFDAWSIPWGDFNGLTAQEWYQTIFCALEITMSIRKLGLLWLSRELWATQFKPFLACQVYQQAGLHDLLGRHQDV